MKKYSYPFIIALFVMAFVSCGVKTHLADVKTETYRVNEALLIAEDAKIKEMIEPYKSQLDEKMNLVIGSFAKSLNKQKPESTLGNFVADIIRDYGFRTTGKKVDFAFQNYGGIRIGNVPKGPVTAGKIYELMPFENMLVVLKMTGADVMQFLNHIGPSNGWPVSDGIKFEIKDNKPQNILIAGKPLALDQIYHVAFPDYIANGGDKCYFLKDLERFESGMLIRDAIIKHILALSSVGEQADAILQERIKIIE
jgi:2',3'-cyclic-nucleotide 2'-phosphodiesterase (5'-nucleotidase family)